MSALEFSTERTHSIEEENDKETTDNDMLPVNSSNSLDNGVYPTEILIYCQNMNRMKSAAKMMEIQNNLLCASYSIIMANETSWDETVRSEEVFGSKYNVYRDDRNLQLSNKRSGGGVLIAVSI